MAPAFVAFGTRSLTETAPFFTDTFTLPVGVTPAADTRTCTVNALPALTLPGPETRTAARAFDTDTRAVPDDAANSAVPPYDTVNVETPGANAPFASGSTAEPSAPTGADTVRPATTVDTDPASAPDTVTRNDAACP